MHRFLCNLVVSLIALGPLAAAEIMPLSDIGPGDRGHGLSVFRGGEPERFEVEVLGVWNEVAPDTSFILARLSGLNLEVSGVVAGMSGSPVYIDGRLAGAISFAWPFAIEPIAGITPIESMRKLSENSVPGISASRWSSPVTVEQLVSGRIEVELLNRHLERLLPVPTDGAVPGVGWVSVGFGATSRELLAGRLGAVNAAGRGDVDGAGTIGAGGSIAAVLIDGDMRLAATGTLTELQDDRLLAFGHPFLSIGALEVPMATAEVITVLSNQVNSFKIVNVGPVVGSFDLDRKSGLRGHVGTVATTTSMRIGIEGEREREFQLELARIPTLTPTLAAISVLGALDAVTQVAGDQGLDLEVRFDLEGHPPVEIRQSFDGANAGIDTVVYLLAFADYLVNNHLAEVEIANLDVTLKQYPRSRLATLVDAHASKTRVRPGEEVSVNLDLTEYRGARRRAAIDLEIPTSIPDGRYSLLVGDGVSIDVARLAIEQAVPITFKQVLELLGSLHSRRQIVVLGVFAGEGLTISGEVLPQLPASVRSLWGAAASTSAIPLQLAIAQQVEEEAELPILGAERIDLEVHRDDPIGAEPTFEPPTEAPAETEGGGSPGSEQSKEGTS